MTARRPGLIAFPIFAICLASPLLAADEHLTDEAIDSRIVEHRTANVTLTVTDREGQPLADQPVVIRQTRHKFLFGCALNLWGFGLYTDQPVPEDLLSAYQGRFAEVMNFATLPVYLGSFERERGNPQLDQLRTIAAWCQRNGIRAKGHPLVWDNVVPRWLQDCSGEEAWQASVTRIRRDVTAASGLVDVWDVFNEAVEMPNNRWKTPLGEHCRQVGAVDLIAQSFATARSANPDATLLINDFKLDDDYRRVIRESLDLGVGIDAIGLQSHMHSGYWGRKKTWDSAQRFADFDLPLHFTEVTLISGPERRNVHGRPPTDWVTTPEGEAKQAMNAVEFYRVLFSHPSVEAITWWDFSDRRAWLARPGGSHPCRHDPQTGLRGPAKAGQAGVVERPGPRPHRRRRPTNLPRLPWRIRSRGGWGCRPVRAPTGRRIRDDGGSRHKVTTWCGHRK